MRGTRVVNTRSPDQAAELDALLIERGAVPLSYPCIDMAPPLDSAPLARALDELSRGWFDWLVLTSANAVRAVAVAAREAGSRRWEAGLRRGRSTRAGLLSPQLVRGPRERSGICSGVAVALQPETYTAADLAKELVARKPGAVLLPLADRARDILPQALRAAGAAVRAVTAYRTVVGQGGVDLAELLRRGEVDAVLFTSPSTVDNLAVRLQQDGGEWSLLQGVCVGCIGPVTAQAAAGKGLQVRVQPEQHTLTALVDALDAYFAAEGWEGSRS